MHNIKNVLRCIKQILQLTVNTHMKRFLVVLLTLTCPALQAQTGKIYGTVTNSINNEALPFVTIILSGTTYGTQSDIDGNYSVENIPPGLYNVEFSFIGFKKKTL